MSSDPPHSPLPTAFADAVDEDTLSRASSSESALPEGLSAEGALAETPLAQLFADLYRTGLTAALLLTREATKKIVYLRAGYPVAARSNIAAECLGKLLQFDGVITETQRRESLSQMRRTRQRQGEVLLEMGALAREDIPRWLALQTRFRVCEAFSWPGGTFKLFLEVEPPAQLSPVDVAPAALIHEGVRSFMAHKRVLELLRREVDRFPHPAAGSFLRYQALQVDAAAEPLLERIDGTRSISELLRTSPLPITETSALLYTLLCTGIVTSEREPGQHWAGLRTVKPGAFKNPITVHTTPKAYLTRLVERLRSASPWEVLGVPEDAPLPTLRLAHQKRAIERHPDRNSGSQDAEVRELAVEALALTDGAFERLTREQEEEFPDEEGTAPITLADPQAAETALGSDLDINERVQRILDAELHHQRGLELLDQGQYKDAAQALSRAVSTYDEEGAFRASLAWAIFQAGLDDESARRALELLDQALEIGHSGRAHRFRGHILYFLGRALEAAADFREALRLDPDNEETQSELGRILEELEQSRR